MPPKKKARRRGWGHLRKLPSGRWQASYVGPDMQRHAAPDTFDASIDAEAWLAIQRQRIAAGTWSAPGSEPEEVAPLSLAEYAATWLEHRDLRDTTRRIYRHALDRYILPGLGHYALEDITPSLVSRWASSVRRQTGPTQAAHSYSLLRTIFNAAVREDIVSANPCRVPGAGQVKKARETTTLEPAEISALAAAVPDDLRALVLLAAWGGLRLGELLELRRRDVELDAEAAPPRGVVHVRRQVQHMTGRPPEVVKPKTRAGVRTVNLPGRVVIALADHVERYAEPGTEGLLFPAASGGHRVPSTVRRAIKRAAEELGHPNLTVHSLRHTALTLAARTGATVAELQARAGHASPAAAMRYQHAAKNRDAEIAARLDFLGA